MNDRTLRDNYRTPHTAQLHVVERFSLLDGGDTLEVHVTIDDAGAFTMPWSAIQRYKRVQRAPMTEERCAREQQQYLNEEVRPIRRPPSPFLRSADRRVVLPAHRGFDQPISCSRRAAQCESRANAANMNQTRPFGIGLAHLRNRCRGYGRWTELELTRPAELSQKTSIPNRNR